MRHGSDGRGVASSLGGRPPAVHICALGLFTALALTRLTHAVPTDPPDFDLGFVASRQSVSGEASRVKALGPLFERRLAEDGRSLLALRPFFSVSEDPGRAWLVTDLLWPVASWKEFRGDVYWRFIFLFGHRFAADDGPARYRFVGLPFLFAGRDADQQEYFAIFPLGGRIHEFLGRDRIVFALFPLYMYSTVGPVVKHDVLFPIISRTRGPDTDRFRVFPLYGRSVNEGRWTKTFVLWPLWTSARYEYEESSGNAFLLFPLVGRADLTDQQSWTILPPLFKYARSADHTQVYCPWPFIQYETGKKERLYIWPLWGRKALPGVESQFLLWPVGWRGSIERHNEVVHRLKALPFLYYESRKTRETQAAKVVENGGDTKGKTTERYVKVWPLCSYWREYDRSRFRTLALWPLKHTPVVERNMAPLWTLYSRERSAARFEEELLWGLYRRRAGHGERRLSVFPLFSSRRSEAGDGSRGWDLLLGLVGYSREGLRRKLKLLYLFNFGGGEEGPQQEEAP